MLRLNLPIWQQEAKGGSRHERDNDLVVGSDALQSVPTPGRRSVWDPQVRAEVLKRAGGHYEHCGEEVFLKADSTRYLEAQHIIALSAGGKGRLSNVVTLCPGHHQEAHFGRNRVSLEAQMIQIVRRKEKVGVACAPLIPS
jgi:5-methylcytosine-specific restriction protein A